jgi:hypothetical protein
MKKIVLGLSVIALSLVAADFSQMSLDELNSLRGNVDVQDRDSFRAEMQSRLEAMTPDERVAFREARVATMGANGLGLNQGMHKGQARGNNQAQRGANCTGDQVRARDGSGVRNINTQQRVNTTSSSQDRALLRDGSGAGSKRGGTR